MSEQVTIAVAVDTTEAQADVAALQTTIDSQVAEWRRQRQIVLTEIHQIDRGLGLLIRGVRLVAEATGQALDPMQNALLGLVSSTSSLIVSTAVALTAGSLGVLTGIALGMAAFAYGMQIAQTAKIMLDFAALRATLDKVNTRLTGIEYGRQVFGAGGVPF